MAHIELIKQLTWTGAPSTMFTRSESGRSVKNDDFPTTDDHEVTSTPSHGGWNPLSTWDRMAGPLLSITRIFLASAGVVSLLCLINWATSAGALNGAQQLAVSPGGDLHGAKTNVVVTTVSTGVAWELEVQSTSGTGQAQPFSCVAVELGAKLWQGVRRGIHTNILLFSADTQQESGITLAFHGSTRNSTHACLSTLDPRQKVCLDLKSNRCGDKSGSVVNDTTHHGDTGRDGGGTDYDDDDDIQLKPTGQDGQLDDDKDVPENDAGRDGEPGGGDAIDTDGDRKLDDDDKVQENDTGREGEPGGDNTDRDRKLDDDDKVQENDTGRDGEPGGDNTDRNRKLDDDDKEPGGGHALDTGRDGQDDDDLGLKTGLDSQGGDDDDDVALLDTDRDRQGAEDDDDDKKEDGNLDNWYRRGLLDPFPIDAVNSDPEDRDQGNGGGVRGGKRALEEVAGDCKPVGDFGCLTLTQISIVYIGF